MKFDVENFVLLEVGEAKEGVRVKKEISQRIEYYTRKVAQRVTVHPVKKQPRSFKYRNYRLMLYKKLMHEEIRKHQEARLC
ncbi:hypothetical protein ACQCU1_03250 [Sutcliffiella horikoshii]|uniref:hypothetical protein n=1 Tax=Sutcliffiella horikoshii TaxID=79883 RepID=UPI003CE6C9EB